jgi:hypothetical protein
MRAPERRTCLLQKGEKSTMILPTITNSHLINERTLSAEIRMFDSQAIFSFMVHPDGRMFYKHLMVRLENKTGGHGYETVPVY